MTALWIGMKLNNHNMISEVVCKLLTCKESTVGHTHFTPVINEEQSFLRQNKNPRHVSFTIHCLALSPKNPDQSILVLLKHKLNILISTASSSTGDPAHVINVLGEHLFVQYSQISGIMPKETISTCIFVDNFIYAHK